MLNCRGNRYSQQHTTLNPSQKAFWNFSWREMARYDLPKAIAAIRQRTNSPTINYVGHSQGGTVLVALLATQPQYNQIISHAGLLAPFILTSHVGFPMNFIYKSFYYFDFNNYKPILQHSLTQNIVSETVCKVFDGKLCNLFLNFLLGPSLDQLDNVSLDFICFFFTSKANRICNFDFAISGNDTSLCQPLSSRCFIEATMAFWTRNTLQLFR